jgi:DNA-binding transcriptional LysR family regulator
MELGQLEAFIAVAREGSFTRAAERLNLAQPSLSARIHHLEQSLGGELFDREERPVRLTSLGEIFLPYAERAVGVLDAGREAVQTARQGAGGRVLVGCPFSLATYLIPEVVNRFSHAHPQAELTISTGHSRYIVGQLADGVINLAFTAVLAQMLRQTQTLLRLHDEMIVAVAPDNPLAKATAVPVAELWRYRLLLISWGPAFDAYMESIRPANEEASGPTVRVPLAAALPMAHQPNTVTFLPRRLAAASGLAAVDVPGIPFPWDVVLITRPGRTLLPLEHAFMDIVSTVWQSSEPGRP